MIPARPPRLAVLLSGGGTTLQNLLDQKAAGTFVADITLVVCSRPDAHGLVRAAAAGIPTAVERPTPPETVSDRVFGLVRAAGADLVVLAGWLHLLSIPDDFRHRVLNIHPSLLPAFGGRGMYGRHVHEAVFEAGVKVSGCTVHFADAAYDTGPIVAQTAVDIAECDSPDEVAAKVFAAACGTYPAAITRVAAGGWRVEGRRVVFGESRMR